MNVEVAPGFAVQVEEDTPNHWVGAWGDLVLVFAFVGSSDDVAHVFTAARIVEDRARVAGKAKVLFVLPPRHARPPSARVRSAILQVSRRLAKLTARLSVVVAGEGFGAAVHRGAVTGVFSLFRPDLPIKIATDFRDGLRFLLGEDHTAIEPLVGLCEQRVALRA